MSFRLLLPAFRLTSIAFMYSCGERTRDRDLRKCLIIRQAELHGWCSTSILRRTVLHSCTWDAACPWPCPVQEKWRGTSSGCLVRETTVCILVKCVVCVSSAVLVKFSVARDFLHSACRTLDRNVNICYWYPSGAAPESIWIKVTRVSKVSTCLSRLVWTWLHVRMSVLLPLNAFR
jgi:hypothetical protein